MKWMLKIPGANLSNWAPSETWEDLFEIWSRSGVEGVILPVSLSHHSVKELDNISELIERSKRFGLRTWMVLPVLNNRSIYEHFENERPRHRHGKDFDFPAWFAPICPTSSHIKGLISEILSNPLIGLPVEVLLIDYLRIPFFWEEWGNSVAEGEWPPYCYCERCVDTFHNDTGFFLDYATPEQWQRWQCNVITGLLIDFHKKVKSAHSRIRIGVQILPLISPQDRSPRPEWVGQNLKALDKHVDFFSPQLYGNLLGWNQDELLSYLVEFTSHERQTVIPSFQISPTRWDRSKDEASTNLRRLKWRLRPLGIESATLFHARNLKDLSEIRRVLGD